MEKTTSEIAEFFFDEFSKFFLEHLKLNSKFLELDFDEQNKITEELLRCRVHAIRLKTMPLEELKEKKLNTGTPSVEWLEAYFHKIACDTTDHESPECFKVTRETPQYPPDKNLIELSNNKNTIKNLPSQYNWMRQFLPKRQFNADNISVFKTLLELEDIAELKEYVPLMQRCVTIEAIEDSGKYQYFSEFQRGTQANIKNILLTPNVDVCIVLNTEMSDRLVLKTNVSTIINLITRYEYYKEFIAVIKHVSESGVKFQFDNLVFLNESRLKFDLIFLPMRLPIRQQHFAVNLLASNSALMAYLFPKYNLHKELVCSPIININLINEAIAKNPEQYQAVHYISSGPNPYAPYIVFGPPGTGKTTTIVEAILQLRLRNPKSRILVAAGSNSACDTIALRICEYYKSNLQLRQHICTTDALPMIRIFSKSIQTHGLDAISDELLKRSNATWCMGTHAYPAVEDILNYGIVVATLSTVGKLVSGDINASNTFTHIFIDEAAASSEPEALVGIVGIKHENNGDCRVILSGDHKQLGAVIKSDLAAKLGLDLSLMERLLASDCYAVDEKGNYDRSLQTRLRQTFRSRKEIVEIYNHLYYDNELKAMNEHCGTILKRKWSFSPDSSYPIYFQAVYGETFQGNSKSSCNNLEINALVWYLQHLIKVDGIKEEDVGVITPYKLQCQRIRRRLVQENWNNVEVGSVENYQGREKQIIIISMVKSFTSLGFLTNPRRLNVMLSRAKSLLLILGNPDTLSGCKDLKYVIEKCKENGTFFKELKLK